MVDGDDLPRQHFGRGSDHQKAQRTPIDARAVIVRCRHRHEIGVLHQRKAQFAQAAVHQGGNDALLRRVGRGLDERLQRRAARPFQHAAVGQPRLNGGAAFSEVDGRK